MAQRGAPRRRQKVLCAANASDSAAGLVKRVRDGKIEVSNDNERRNIYEQKEKEDHSIYLALQSM